MARELGRTGPLPGHPSSSGQDLGCGGAVEKAARSPQLRPKAGWRRRKRLTVVCCSQRGGTGFGLECFWCGPEPRGFRLPSREPAHPQSLFQRGLLSARLRVGDSPQGPPAVQLPMTWPRPGWASSGLSGVVASSPVDNPERPLPAGQPLALSRKQRRLRPSWLPSCREGTGGARVRNPARPHARLHPSCPGSPQLNRVRAGTSQSDLRMLCLCVPETHAVWVGIGDSSKPLDPIGSVFSAGACKVWPSAHSVGLRVSSLPHMAHVPGLAGAAWFWQPCAAAAWRPIAIRTSLPWCRERLPERWGSPPLAQPALAGLCPSTPQRSSSSQRALSWCALVGGGGQWCQQLLPGP